MEANSSNPKNYGNVSQGPLVKFDMPFLVNYAYFRINGNNQNVESPEYISVESFYNPQNKPNLIVDKMICEKK